MAVELRLQHVSELSTPVKTLLRGEGAQGSRVSLHECHVLWDPWYK